ncbi:hypothetical protein CEXT_813761 [Caerostris extrusa]|uniref:Uncharacterized protein n=1 Tax=Caerostris extrusa TaxID=172846 RepID=A0AAV4PY35_CAEEX|nr:hypothetical protein CEXT_813761 [Caerostris extrusa]
MVAKLQLLPQQRSWVMISRENRLLIRGHGTTVVQDLRPPSSFFCRFDPLFVLKIIETSLDHKGAHSEKMRKMNTFKGGRGGIDLGKEVREQWNFHLKNGQYFPIRISSPEEIDFEENVARIHIHIGIAIIACFTGRSHLSVLKVN